ncbi:MAG: carbohydrate kinase family protein [Anaerolineae bacterium]|nr:carbohydrate kinase family protein [Anaerolineae bacterium]
MTYHEHRVLVIGASGLDMKVTPRTLAVELGRSNPGRIQRSWGGVARNIAENLVYLGAEVDFITAVGDDHWGHQLLEQLNTLGINTQASIISFEKPTGSFVSLHHSDGRPWVAFDDMEVIREIVPGHLNRFRRLFREADMICIDANLSANALQTVFRLAEKYEVPVCADPTAALLTHRLHPYLPNLAVLTPDQSEAEALLGMPLLDNESIIQGARHLVQLGVDLAIITLGAEGLAYATSEESGRLPAFSVEAVDLAGAGDALTAAVAYSLLEGVSPEEVVRLGMAAAAQTLLCQETVCPTLSLESLYEKLV